MSMNEDCWRTVACRVRCLRMHESNRARAGLAHDEGTRQWRDVTMVGEATNYIDLCWPASSGLASHMGQSRVDRHGSA